VTDFGDLLPDLVVRPPGPASRALAERLRRVESRNVTWLTDDFPVFWTEAKGANVRDVDGNVHLDLTGAFGVALAGHGHPRIVHAVQNQAGRLLHGMGDVHPPAAKVELLERLARLAPWEGAKSVLATTGSEAVETALKTALIATGRPGVLAFEGAYHGLTMGSLAATARPLFRERFQARLYPGVAFAPFPGADPGPDELGADAALARVEALLREGAPNGEAIGAVIVEPVQGRGGLRIPPEDFLAHVARVTREHGALVIADEILTGTGRCKAPLASTRLGLVPDILCLGKALGGGMPLSACLGRPDVMDAWPPSTGEAIHTSTFLGHPGACAAALAVLDLLDEGLGRAADQVGRTLLAGLQEGLADLPGVRDVRGLGALVGIELEGDEGPAVRVAWEALAEGVLVLPAGPSGQVVELLPSAYLTDEQAAHGVDVLVRIVRRVVA
jgi:4-aminobutyrate aminotransferase/(S)-3-amino-2-methylpropionate transaminase